MEKQRAGTKIRISIGLLIPLLIFGNTLSAQTYSQMKALRMISQNDVIYAGKECQFSLVIPSAKTADVQMEIPSLPAGVSFISMRRTDFIENGVQSGTKIDLQISFRVQGEYKLPPLRVKVKNRSYDIPFDSVVVQQDPATLSPCLIIHFDNGVEVKNAQPSPEPLFSVRAGDKIRFTVYVQYTVQVINFEWSIPKNALFTEVKKYKITEGKPRGSGFSAELIPVARFEWQPLVSGLTALPDMHLTATSYGGMRVKLVQPDMRISVLPAEKKKTGTVNNNESYFSYAFTETENVNDSKARTDISEENCKKLAELRIRERHSPVPWKAAAERRAFEKKLGISGGRNESSEILFILLVIVTAVFVLLALLLFILKKTARAIPFIVCACAAFVCTVIAGVHLSSLYGIFKGGSIRSVPDVASGFVSPVASGQRVRIEEITGKWIYIQYGSTGGWVSSSSIIVIK
jgi:hypothetical protein